MYYLGVDCGTSSVRVGLFNEKGELIDSKTEAINVFNFQVDFYEQSSNEIFDAVCKCIKKIIAEKSNVWQTDQIASIGFDGTCSLVVLDSQFEPVSVSPSKTDSINVIMWMDHRSKCQADFINSTNHERLKSVGNKISLEMDLPKILWLKQNDQDSYKRAAYFFSLPDYLVWRFTGQDVRSVCCTTCKWLFVSSETKNEWDVDFLNLIGLNDLSANLAKIGNTVKKPFEYLQNLKINKETANILGLSCKSEIKVGISMIDAHAGGIGGLAMTMGFINNISESNNELGFLKSIQFHEALVLVSGTSSCLMASSKYPKYVNGIWGPYYSAMVPDLWLNEAGQSACGKLIDNLIENHPSYSKLKSQAPQNTSIYEFLHSILINISSEKNIELSKLTKSIHIYPDFHGNRSPLADSTMTGAVYGLGFDNSLNNLALSYLAYLQSLAYQTKHIISVLNQHDINFKIITIIGGLSNNKLYCQLICDICNTPVLTAQNNDSSVLLGAAILGASNVHENSSFNELINKFSFSKDFGLLVPNKNLDSYHKQKYHIYLDMLESQRKYKNLMEEF